MSSDAIELCQRCHKEEAVYHVIATQDPRVILVVIEKKDGELLCSASQSRIERYKEKHWLMKVTEERVCQTCMAVDQKLINFYDWIGLDDVMTGSTWFVS